MAKQEEVTLDSILEQINKKYGKGSIVKAGDVEQYLAVSRIKTGVLAVDLVTGGGIPRGRLTRLFGRESSFKTMLALMVIARAQEEERERQSGHKCVFIDTENTFDPEVAKNLGIDLGELLLTQPDTLEQAGDVIALLLNSGKVDLLVWDSIAASTPQAEYEASLEDWQQGLGARLVNKLIRKITAASIKPGIDGFKPTVVVINQIREKIGVMYGNPETTPYGKQQLFQNSLDLRMSVKKVEVIDKTKNPKPLYAEVGVTVNKSKVCIPKRSAVFRFWLRDYEGHCFGDTEEEKLMFSMANSMGLITMGDGGGYWFGQIHARTQKEFREILRGDLTFQNQLRNSIISVYNGTAVREVEDEAGTQVEVLPSVREGSEPEGTPEREGVRS